MIGIDWEKQERTFLLITCYFLLVTCYFLLVTCYFLLVICYFLLVICYLLLVTFYLQLATNYFLFATSYYLLVTLYFSFATTYSLVITFYSLCLCANFNYLLVKFQKLNDLKNLNISKYAPNLHIEHLKEFQNLSQLSINNFRSPRNGVKLIRKTYIYSNMKKTIMIQILNGKFKVIIHMIQHL